MNKFEKQAQRICTREGGAFDAINDMLDRIDAAEPGEFVALEDLTLAPFDSDIYDERMDVTRVNRLAMRAIYEQFRVDPTRATTDAHFGMGMLEPLTFMGVRTVGHRSEEALITEARHYSELGIGFFEEHKYLKQGNPGLGVMKTRDPFDPLRVTAGYSVHPANRVAVPPHRFRFSVYQLARGAFRGGRFSA
jgi:hypothetical protein